MKKKINCSVVGLGFGETHLKHLKKNKFCSVKKICDFDLSKKNYFENKYKTTFTSNYKDIINDSNIKMISIATYDESHFKILKEAIHKKKNIFVEKPICQTEQELKKIQILLKKNKNIFFTSNMVLRTHPKFKKIYEIIKSGKIGKIFHIEGEYNYGRFYKITNGWRGKSKNYSVTLGGGIHIIDLIHWYIDSKIDRVIGVGNNLNSKNTVFKRFDTITSLIKFKNGITGKLTSNFPIKAPHNHIMNIYGNKGTILSSGKKIFLYRPNRKNYKKITIRFKKSKSYKYGVLKNFIYSILGKEKLIVNRDVTLKNMKTAFAIDKSLKTKKWEKIDLK